MSERWVELRVVVPRAWMEHLSELAFAHGASGVQEAPPPGAPLRFRQPWDTETPPLPFYCTFRAWFAEADQVRAQAAFAAALPEGELEVLPVVEEDWSESWKLHHHRVVLSERLRVAPPWEALPGDIVIPPGHAFGTGDHPTTLAALAAVERLAAPGRRCLDLGCGSGVLALAAAHLGMRAEGVDIDPEAVSAARENAALNQLEVAFSTTPAQQLEGPYELVLANLYAEVLAALAPELLRLTGRHLVLAGILADREALVLDALSPPLAVQQRAQDGDWVSLHLVRL